MISLPVRIASLMNPFRFPTYSRSSDGLERNNSCSFSGQRRSQVRQLLIVHLVDKRRHVRSLG